MFFDKEQPATLPDSAETDHDDDGKSWSDLERSHNMPKPLSTTHVEATSAPTLLEPRSSGVPESEKEKRFLQLTADNRNPSSPEGKKDNEDSLVTDTNPDTPDVTDIPHQYMDSTMPNGSGASAEALLNNDLEQSEEVDQSQKKEDISQRTQKHEEHMQDAESRSCTCIPLRYAVAWMVFVGMVIIHAMRTNVGVTVLTILDKETHRFNNETGGQRDLPSVNWDTKSIGYLHSVFYLGYMITQLPGGYLTTRLPSHMLFGVCILISCILNLSLPMSIEVGGYFITVVIRFSQGLSEGLLYPACYGILRHWSTPQERGRVGALVLTGAYLGPVVGFPMAGFITHYIGWQYIYYVNGGAGLIYVLLWTWLSEEKPAHHKGISVRELCFIEDLQGSERIDYEGVQIPWADILTSLPVASLCLCNFARNWVFILTLTNEPFYLNMFRFSIAENGAFSALPHVFKMSASLTSGLVADFILDKQLLSTTNTRKLLTMGFGVQAVFFTLLTQTTDGTVAMVLLTLAIGFGGFVVSGWQLNHYDLSARYAPVLVAVTSTFGNLASISAPIVTGVLTGSKTVRGWDEVFIITSGITGTACLSFLLFGSGDRQSWAVPSDTTQLVVKEDKRRRTPNTPTEREATQTPVFTYTKPRDGSDGQVVTSHVPNYGSQERTTLQKKDKDDGNDGADNVRR